MRGKNDVLQGHSFAAPFLAHGVQPVAFLYVLRASDLPRIQQFVERTKARNSVAKDMGRKRLDLRVIQGLVFIWFCSFRTTISQQINEKKNDPSTLQNHNILILSLLS